MHFGRSQSNQHPNRDAEAQNNCTSHDGVCRGRWNNEKKKKKQNHTMFTWISKRSKNIIITKLFWLWPFDEHNEYDSEHISCHFPCISMGWSRKISISLPNCFDEMNILCALMLHVNTSCTGSYDAAALNASEPKLKIIFVLMVSMMLRESKQLWMEEPLFKVHKIQFSVP